MVTTLDAVNTIYDILKDGSLTISGDVYKLDSRPAGSEKEDVVVNAITMLDGIIQDGTCNINIHVPDKNVAGDTAIYKIPNTDRLSAIGKQVVDIMGGDIGVVKNKEMFYVGAISNAIKEDGLDEHYLNIRIEVEVHNQISAGSI